MTSGIVTNRARLACGLMSMHMILSSRLRRALAAALIGLMLPPVGYVASADAPGADVGSPNGLIKGGGATVPAPVYLEWAAAYERTGGARVSYNPVGSGEGLQQIRNHQVDFGASDAPLTSDVLGAAGLMQFPVVVGGVVPVINIMGIKPGQLRLSSE